MSLRTNLFHENQTYWKKLLVGLPLTAAFFLILSIYLTLVKFAPEGETSRFLTNFVFSEICGLVCCFLMITIREIVKPQGVILHITLDLLGITMGAVAGLYIGSIILGIEPSFFIRQYGFFFKLLLSGLFIGFTIHYFFSIHAKASEAEVMAQEERIKRLTSEKGMTEANLKLLQAQIEPHFLFNTLSNILTLMESDPEKGKTMLSDLTHYLRTSLSKTRKDMSTVGQEMELIKDYLKIYQVRMGDRLRFEINIPDDINDFPLQPMLIQPLVENAIRHGLEPEIKGGEIRIAGSINGGKLRIEVIDNGTGFYENSNPGMGIENIRERLKSLYGERGSLILEENRPTGVKAIIEVPYESG